MPYTIINCHQDDHLPTNALPHPSPELRFTSPMSSLACIAVSYVKAGLSGKRPELLKYYQALTQFFRDKMKDKIKQEMRSA